MGERLPRHVAKRLPRARLISFTRVRGKPFWARFRLANARLYYLGWISVTIRAPWLPHVAKQLHPEAFKNASDA